jgi:hypothetical protein
MNRDLKQAAAHVHDCYRAMVAGAGVSQAAYQHTAEACAAIGRDLLTVLRQVGPREFLTWLELEADIPLPAANRMMERADPVPEED